MDWLDTIAQKSLRLQKVVGLHAQILAGGEVLYSFVELHKEKGVVVQKASAVQKSLDSFCQQTSPELPLCLSISGKGILTKKVESLSGKDPLEEVLPHANKEEFYFSLLEEEVNTFVTIGRKEVVDTILQELKKQSLQLASVELGFSVVSTILPFVDSSEIYLEQLQLSVNAGSIQDFKILKGEGRGNQIGDDQISPSCTLPYAHGLQLIMGIPGKALSNLHFTTEWRQRLLHKKLLAGILGFFFTLLLVNFFVFSDLSSENAALTGVVGQKQFQLTQLQQLEKKVKAQENLYQTLGLGRQSFFSFYADRLAATIQNREIKLLKMEVQPMLESKNRSLAFEKDKIQVSGSCNNPLVINSWLERLEKEDWVKRILNRRFFTHPQSGNGEFSFELYVEEKW